MIETLYLEIGVRTFLTRELNGVEVHRERVTHWNLEAAIEKFKFDCRFQVAKEDAIREALIERKFNS